MENIGELIAGVAGKFHKVSGECPAHGPSEVGVLREGGAWYCPKCFEAKMAEESRAKWIEDRNATLYAIAKIPSKYAGQKFVAHTPEHKAARGIAKTFRDFIVEKPRWGVLVLMGTVGTGKTLLACEFAESWIKNLTRSVRYTTANGMIKEIQASYGREGKSEEGEIMRFVQYDLLILDEIDAKPETANANLLLTEIINRRYGEEKPVIVITNQPFEKIADFVGDRVADRLHENAFVCSFDWPSFRRNPVA
jgi:DNA replication protein DnaC